MIPYMSYWCGGYAKEPSEFVLLTHKIACHLAKQQYGECHLITDAKGMDYFNGCNYSSILNLKEIDDLPKSYKGEPWSWGKLVSYRHLASKKIHFLHLDYDVFLFKRLPQFIENADVFAQSKENDIFEYYEVDTFLKYAKTPYLLNKVKNADAANCGIFGGKNHDFIMKYASSAIEMVLDKQNELAWKVGGLYKATWNRATIAEQFYLVCASKYYNIPITYLSNNYIPQDDECKKYGYTHLWGAKGSPYWQKQIRQVAEKLGL